MDGVDEGYDHGQTFVPVEPSGSSAVSTGRLLRSARDDRPGEELLSHVRMCEVVITNPHQGMMAVRLRAVESKGATRLRSFYFFFFK